MTSQRRYARVRRTRKPARSRTRRRYPARYRLTFVDRLILAGCVAAAVYLAAHHILAAPRPVATVFALVGFGFTLGALVTVRQWPRLRSPIVWRGRR